MGLDVSVYADRTNLKGCTNGGFSTNYNELCLVNVEGPTEPRAGVMPALLVKGNLPGCVKIVGAQKVASLWFEIKPPGAGPMFGGNFAYTSDSRFHRAIETLNGGSRSFGAVPIHDRYESQELNDQMDR